MSAGAKLESVWIQWSDCGNHIRRWQRTPFYAGEEITALVVEPMTASHPQDYKRGVAWAAGYVELAGEEASHPASVIACRTIAAHLRREAQEAVEDADLALEKGA